MSFEGKRIDGGEWAYGFYGEKINVKTGENDAFIIETNCVYLKPTLTLSNGEISYFTDIQVDPASRSVQENM